MPHFNYTARAKSGEKLTGAIVASSKAAAVEELQRRNLFPIAIDSEGAPSVPPAATATGGILFPNKLQRLDYLIRWLLFFILVPIAAAVLLPLAIHTGLPLWLPFIVIVVLMLMRFPCADIPRFRSIGWSPWLVLLFMIPLINLVIQLILFFTPAKDIDD